MARGIGGAIRKTLKEQVLAEFGPDDWQKRHDPKRDRAYWYSPSRKKSVWTDPSRRLKLMLMAVTAFGAAGRAFHKQGTDGAEYKDDGKANDWEKRLDKTRNVPYYYSPSRRVALWSDPNAPADASGAGAGAGAGDENDWEEKIDPVSGYKYWFSPSRATSTWDDPTTKA